MAKSVLLMFVFLTFSLLTTMAEGDILVYNAEFPRNIEDEFRDMPARFGNSIPDEGLRAMVITSSPRNACTPIAPKPGYPNFTGKWVVLAARYDCSFEKKVRNAQAAGYDGIIVHNINSSDLEIMSAKNPEGILIPSVFVSEETGIIMDTNYQYSQGYFVVINGDLPFNINKHLLLPFAIVVGLCLIIMTIFMITKCMRDRRRDRRHRLSNSALKKIPTSKFAKGDPYDMCAICLDDYVEGDKLRVLPCSHAYHCKCIDPWLTKNRRVCPVCKRKVFASGETRPQRSGRESSSGTDTEDDRAPLIRSSSGNTTQGGTFNPQSENPFVRASRDVTIPVPEDTTSSSDESTNGRGAQDVRSNDGSDDRQPILSGAASTTTQIPSASWITYALDREHSKEKRNRRESPSRRSKRTDKKDKKSSSNAERRGSDTTQDSTQSSSNLERSNPDNASMEPVVSLSSDRHSINDGQDSTENDNDSVDRGRIGVAALPNTENLVHSPDVPRGDFIV